MYLPTRNHQLCTQLLCSKVPYLSTLFLFPSHKYTYTYIPPQAPLPKQKKKKLVIIVIVIVFFFFSSKFGNRGISQMFMYLTLPSTYA